jgi:hypothetical protein
MDLSIAERTWMDLSIAELTCPHQNHPKTDSSLKMQHHPALSDYRVFHFALCQEIFAHHRDDLFRVPLNPP